MSSIFTGLPKGNKKIWHILALDLSTTCTGYAKYEYNLKTDVYKLIEVGSIQTKERDRFDRIRFIEAEMVKRGLFKWAHAFVLENYAFAGNKVTQLAEFNGIIRYAVHKANKPSDVIAPATVKKQVTGKGNASKEEVREALRQLPMFQEVAFANDDESDAAAVGLAYISLYQTVGKLEP